MTDLEIYLIDRIKEERKKFEQDLARGLAGKTADEIAMKYQYATGTVRGLDTVVSFMIEFNEARKEDDE
jgi:hypothetical protein